MAFSDNFTFVLVCVRFALAYLIMLILNVCFSFRSVLNTSSLLCDCYMQWLGPWLTDNHFQHSVSAACAHPASLFGRSVLSVSPELFVCGQSGLLFIF